MFDFVNSLCVHIHLAAFSSVIGVVAGFLWLLHKKTLVKLVFIPHQCLFVTLVVWWVYSVNMPKEVDKVDFYEVKSVTFPDGKTVQMFTEDGQHRNANLMFSQVISDGMIVERTTYKKVYFGLYYGDEKISPGLRPTYKLTKK